MEKRTYAKPGRRATFTRTGRDPFYTAGAGLFDVTVSSRQLTSWPSLCDHFTPSCLSSPPAAPLHPRPLPVVLALPLFQLRVASISKLDTSPGHASLPSAASMESSSFSRGLQLPSEPEHTQEQKAPKPSLLPAFEPLSSSPFPRPTSSKRKFDEGSPTYPRHSLKYYPTPVPTSSTGILVSSPQKRPVLARTISVLSERQPLGAMPTVELPANGDILRMGRSSNSADYQLSTNRLISRVHVQAAYYAPNVSYPYGYIELECLGWNGATIHCGGNVFQLNKSDTYMSENPEQEIMLDVQDTRVMIAWPQIPAKSSWDSEDDASPTRRPSPEQFASSPPILPRSPVSQSPIRQPVFGAASTLLPQMGPVHVFEDDDVREQNGSATPTPTSPIPVDVTFIHPSQLPRDADCAGGVSTTKASSLTISNDSFSDEDEDDDENEENDPIVHSFGPFGANLNSKLASFSTATPLQPLSAQHRRSIKKSSGTPRFRESPLKNHIINQLAYSRIHSQPLSTIHSNLPDELRKAQVKQTGNGNKESNGTSTPVPQLSKQDLKRLMDGIPCIGEIPRSGKDAAGQPLENEFYYVPEMDSDMLRRETVGVRGTGLRSVRKQHKVRAM